MTARLPSNWNDARRDWGVLTREIAVTHSPGCMFVTDRLAEDAG